MKPLFAALAFLACVGTLSGADEIPPFQWRKTPQNILRAGESILYVVKYGFVPAGHASMEIRTIENVGDRPAYYVMSKAKTNKTMDLIFKVRDKNQTWIDVESLCSLRFRQTLREGFHHREKWTDFDHPAGRFVATKFRKGKESRDEGTAPAFVQDALSALYYVRTLPLEAGKDFTFDVNSGGKTWPMKIHVPYTEMVKVPAGRFECFKIEPVLAGEGIFQNEGALEVWMTNDERRVPVLLRSKVFIGSFDAEMTEYVGQGTLQGAIGESDMGQDVLSHGNIPATP